MPEIPGPTYHTIKDEIVKVTEELIAMRGESDPLIRQRIESALRDLDIAFDVLYCGQSQSALDPGPPPEDSLLARVAARFGREGGGRR